MVNGLWLEWVGGIEVAVDTTPLLRSTDLSPSAQPLRRKPASFPAFQARWTLPWRMHWEIGSKESSPLAFCWQLQSMEVTDRAGLEEFNLNKKRSLLYWSTQSCWRSPLTLLPDHTWATSWSLFFLDLFHCCYIKCKVSWLCLIFLRPISNRVLIFSDFFSHM